MNTTKYFSASFSFSLFLYVLWFSVPACRIGVSSILPQYFHSTTNKLHWPNFKEDCTGIQLSMHILEHEEENLQYMMNSVSEKGSLYI